MRPCIVAAVLILYTAFAIIGYFSLTARPEISPDKRPQWIEALE